MIFTLDIELLFRSYQIIAIQDRLPFHLPQDLLVFHRTYLTPNQPWEVSILPSQPEPPIMGKGFRQDNSPRCFRFNSPAEATFRHASTTDDGLWTLKLVGIRVMLWLFLAHCFCLIVVQCMLSISFPQTYFTLFSWFSAIMHAKIHALMCLCVCLFGLWTSRL